MCTITPGFIDRGAINEILEEIRKKLPGPIPPLGHVRTITGRFLAVCYGMAIIIGALACLPVALILFFVPRVRLALFNVFQFLRYGFEGRADRWNRGMGADGQNWANEMREILNLLTENETSAQDFLKNFNSFLSRSECLHTPDGCIDFNQAANILIKIDPKELFRANHIWWDLFALSFNSNIDADAIYKLATNVRDAGKSENSYANILPIVRSVENKYSPNGCMENGCGVHGLFFLQCLLGTDKPNLKDFLALKDPAHKPLVREQIDGAIKALEREEWPKDFNLLPPKSTV
jgi:hypothetical protein